MPQTMSANIHTAIQAVNQQFMAALARGDVPTAASLYTEDSAILPAGQPEVRGRHAVEAFWQTALNQGVTGIDLATREVQGMGTDTFEVGRFTLHGPHSAVLDEGHYMLIWRHENGHWCVHRDIFNSSPSPVQDAEPAT